MNVATIVLAGLVCLGLSVPAFAGSFEGVVTMKDMSDDGTTGFCAAWKYRMTAARRLSP